MKRALQEVGSHQLVSCWLIKEDENLTIPIGSINTKATDHFDRTILVEWWDALLEGIQEARGGEKLEIANIGTLFEESEKFCWEREGEKKMVSGEIAICHPDCHLC